MAPRGIFGLPHGVLSTPDEQIAFVVGLVALLFAVFYDGDFDLRPVGGAAAVGLLVAVGASLVAPPAVTNEWHIPVGVVLLVVGSVAYARYRG